MKIDLGVMMLKGSCHCGRAGWTLEGEVGQVTACNCTLCRRYGALWAYGLEGLKADLFGKTKTYSRSGKANPALEIHFCAECGSVIGYRSLRLEADGTRKIAVNVRLAPPEAVFDNDVVHFDGLSTFEDLPSDGRRIRDLWS
jgi:hypothetical protein